MRLNSYCIGCQIRKQEEKIREFEDEDRKVAYLQEVLRRFASLSPQDCAPSMSAGLRKYYQEFWGIPAEDYSEIKKNFNTWMLSLEDDLKKNIQKSPDPLASALVYARVGNYIDFSAIPDVNRETALSLIEDADKDGLDAYEYKRFCEDLDKASSLVYVTDNCGEIVLDKLTIEVLKERYPRADITVLVRGLPTVNDATLEDASMCGLTKLVKVIGNGTDIPGTWLPGISQEAKSLLEKADVILSKGQGNYETLHGSGMNIYYLFLCKCGWFIKQFQARPLQGMFVNERRIKNPY